MEAVNGRYVVDVGYASHDDLKAGLLESGPRSRVVVAAVDDVEAMLVACQMVAARSGLMPTSALLRDWPQ